MRFASSSRVVLSLAAMLAGMALGAPTSEGNSAVETAAATCTANRVIDNFSSWSNRTNSLGAVSGDDKTMASTAAATTGGGTLTFTPRAGAYLYENLPACEDATVDGYTAVSFAMSGPAQASFLLELQTKASCTATAYKSAYHNVTVPTGAATTVTVPLSAFEGANLAAVTSLIWGTFNKTGTGATYTIGNVQLVCGK